MLSEKLRENSEKAWTDKTQRDAFKTMLFLVLATFLILLFSSLVFAQGEPQKLQVDYYGVVSSAGDVNMLKMAQDMFYNQLKSVDNYIVNDYRESNAMVGADQNFSLTTQKGHIVFFAEINEDNSDGTKKWNCTLKAIDPATEKIFTKGDTYESYYKILVGAKPSIEELLANFKGAGDNPSFQKIEVTDSGDINVSTETLAGTWSGESDTNKIVILRGGRGFVIFKNGASMNISVRIISGTTTTVEIVQVGKSNASFYPGLQREVALQAAPTAPPIVWTMIMEDEMTLSGTKKTLVAQGNTATVGEEQVVWTKKN